MIASLFCIPVILKEQLGARLQQEGFQGGEGGQGRQIELGTAGNVQHSQGQPCKVGRQLQQLEVAPQGQPLQVSQLGPGVGYLFQPHPPGAMHRHRQRQLCQLQQGKFVSCFEDLQFDPVLLFYHPY